MGDVIRTDRFPTPKTPAQRETLRRKLARRTGTRRARVGLDLPPTPPKRPRR